VILWTSVLFINLLLNVSVILLTHLLWGVSGGMIVLWNSSVFSGLLIEVKWFGPMIRFTSVHNNSSWVLVCVYGLAKGWRGIILCPGYIIFSF
jgi:hypothetical protein